MPNNDQEMSNDRFEVTNFSNTNSQRPTPKDFFRNSSSLSASSNFQIQLPNFHFETTSRFVITLLDELTFTK